MSTKRLTSSPTMRPLVSSLFSAAKKPAAKKPAATATIPKAGVIDWRLNKPEIISVDSLDLHYTSLRDVMFLQYQCHSTESVSGGGGGGSPRTRMKNHLVEQAARAYLQPLNVVDNSTQFFPWNWQKIMGYAPLTFSMSMPRLVTAGGGGGGSGGGGGDQCCGLMGFFSKLSLSRTLKYLLGRARPPHAGFLNL